MEDFSEFLNYYDKVRERTLRVAACTPPDKLEWRFKANAFSVGDLLRHIAAIERFMYAESALFKPVSYPGHGEDLAKGYDAVLAFMNQTHAESMAIFRALSPEDWQKKTQTPAQTPITLWKWLRLMPEHEIHHRGQIYTLLSMLDVKTPPLYGLTSEEVKDRSGF